MPIIDDLFRLHFRLTKAVEDNGHGYPKFSKDGKHFIEGPDAVDDEGFTDRKGQLDLHQEDLSLQVCRGWAAGIESTFSDGEHIAGGCGPDQTVGKPCCLVCRKIPGMQAYGIIAIHRDRIEISEQIPDREGARIRRLLVCMDINERHGLQFRTDPLKICGGSGAGHPALVIFFGIYVDGSFFKGEYGHVGT